MSVKRIAFGIVASAIAFSAVSNPAEAGYRFDQGYVIYQAEIGNEGCEADFDANYRGWRNKPLPKRLANKGWSDLAVGEYLPNKKGYYVWLAPYSGACEG